MVAQDCERLPKAEASRPGHLGKLAQPLQEHRHQRKHELAGPHARDAPAGAHRDKTERPRGSKKPAGAL